MTEKSCQGADPENSERRDCWRNCRREQPTPGPPQCFWNIEGSGN